MFLASFLENDPLRGLLELHPVWVGLIVATFSVPAYWAIDAICSRFDKNIDFWGGTWSEWYSNWVGDFVCLSLAVVYASGFYRNAHLESGNWTTTSSFSLGCMFGGATIATGFILVEEIGGAYKGWQKVNPNRLYHWLYMSFMSYILLGAVMRAFFDYTIYSGGKDLAWLGLAYFGIWFVTIIFDRAHFPNPFWDWVRRRGYTNRRAN